MEDGRRETLLLARMCLRASQEGGIGKHSEGEKKIHLWELGMVVVSKEKCK